MKKSRCSDRRDRQENSALLGIDMQGTISDKVRSNATTFGMWLKHELGSAQKLVKGLGPSASIVVLHFAIVLGGVLSSCLSCSLVRIVIMAAYVFGLAAFQLYKKSKDVCKAEASLDLILLHSIAPVALFIVSYLFPAVVGAAVGQLALPIPLLGGVLGSVFGVLIAATVFTFALSYSQFLLGRRVCGSPPAPSWWTLKR